ncbi:uncharacterized protein LOC131621649 [Vicia villosa]|uniref:uncharacterized protein LOC131621649 n=1 Tax=Vicia villosa TaxID=3911 RepID=UPI00273BDE3A|nr:uncharacterized protein LOC131621649 [Vicia villosa]
MAFRGRRKRTMCISIRSCYALSNVFHVPFGLEKEFVKAFNLNWKLDVSHKIKAFGWRCFINRLSTRDLLLIRGISLPSSIVCVLCRTERETLNHILFSCGVFAINWKEVASWIGFIDSESDCIMSIFLRWNSFCKSNKVKFGREGSIWLASFWAIWKLRNEIIFRNNTWNVFDTVLEH